MIRDYCFKDIEKYLEKRTDIGKDILDAFDSLMDAALIFSPIILGPQFLSMLELLEVKEGLMNLGRKVYDFIAEKIELDYVKRTEQIRAAYALISYTAFFDAFQDAIPKDVIKELKLGFEEKKELLEKADKESTKLQSSSTAIDIHGSVFYADHITSFSEIKKKLGEVYQRVSNNLLNVIIDANIFNEEKKEDKERLKNIEKSLDKMPKRAIKVYEAQYIELATKFNDFALFAQLQNFEGIHNSIVDILKYASRIDVGLNNLNKIVNSISTDYSSIQVQDIVSDLKSKYISFINKAIIDDKEIKSDDETMRIRFPKIVDAFIPQSYKCLSYQQKGTKLEDNLIWKQLLPQHDLDKFFLRYLHSLDSIDYPLIILGQPGSGKSLLTLVLSAQLMSEAYTVIRIPLREVNAEDGIDVLVEDHIKKMTNRPLAMQGYGGFAAQFKEKPLTIILDGYDELLQAKGDVFSGYLEKVRTFQQDQKMMNRPIRIIVTSRITLIDKARIPENATILRLLEFDSEQQKQWIDIWNNTNADYFNSSNIKPFSLQLNDRGKKNRVFELAEQPLLLLMLALYDSEANELAQMSNIKRTELYDSLLRRFVRRERSRYVPGFMDMKNEAQEKIIEQEMNRLGVVAIGMYNRQEVVILSKQLEEDLQTFDAHRNDGSPKANTLKESESVLGGFFFIHKSTAQDIEANSESTESAYEFLHNTFGEFLVADFILRNAINEVKNIIVDRKYKSSDCLSSPDQLKAGWFYCLMFVPLYSRPVVIEMLREHANKALERESKKVDCSISITHDEFIENLQYLVKNHLNMILNTRDTPKVMRDGICLKREMSLLGYLSTYSLNLVILVTALCPNGFEFCEKEYLQVEANILDSRPWDKLTSLWKAWFSPADLTGLSVILRAQKSDETVVKVKCNDKFEATRYEHPMDIQLCVSYTLGDTMNAGLAGIYTERFNEITRLNNDGACEMLRNESVDLYFTYLISLLRKEMNILMYGDKDVRKYHVRFRKINKIIKIMVSDKGISSINADTISNLFEVIENCIMRKIVFCSVREELISVVYSLLKSGMSKKTDSAMVSGINLIQRIISDSTPFLLCLLDEHIIRYSCRKGDWIDEIEQFLHFTPCNTKKGKCNLGEYKGGNAFEMSLLQRNSNRMREYDYDSVFTEDNIDILLETNPELLSCLILSLINNSPKEQHRHIAITVMESFMRHIQSVGIVWYDFNTIINVISIARYNKAKTFLNHIRKELKNLLFKNMRSFMSAIYLYPKFLADLMNVMPKKFDDDIRFLLRNDFIKMNLMHANPNNWLEYIRIMRCFYPLFVNVDYENEKMPKELYMFNQLILELINLSEIDFEQLTISQIENLIWYSDITDNQSISMEIKDLLRPFYEVRKSKN